MKTYSVTLSVDMEMTDKAADNIDFNEFFQKRLYSEDGINIKINNISDISCHNKHSLKKKKENGLQLHAINHAIDKDEYLRFKSSDIYIELLEKDGMYAVNDGGKPKFDMWFDNIGIFSCKLHPCYGSISVGIYVRKGNKFAMMYHQNDNGRRFMYSNADVWTLNRLEAEPPKHKNMVKYLDHITNFQGCLPFYDATFNPEHTIYQTEYGDRLNWFKDDTIILDDDIKLVPDFDIGKVQNYILYVGDRKSRQLCIQDRKYIESLGSDKKYYSDCILSEFLEKFNYAKEHNDSVLLGSLINYVMP